MAQGLGTQGIGFRIWAEGVGFRLSGIAALGLGA